MKRLQGLAVLALVVAAAAGCGAPISTVPGTAAPVDDGTRGPTASASTSASRTTRPSGPPASPSATASGSARTLVLPPLVRNQIIDAWVAGVGADREDVEGISPGTGYYGYMPSTGTYWATAEFDPSPAWERKVKADPSSQVALLFQGGPWIFSHKQGQGWRYLGDSGGSVCPPKVPAAMLAAWGLSTANC